MNGLPVACFAPPMSDGILDGYQERIDSLPESEIKDALVQCLQCVEAWWALPESTRKDGPRFDIKHKDALKTIQIKPLENAHTFKLNPTTPWPRECDSIQSLFDKIPVEEKSLRDMAFHLLWYAKELSLDREPITMDALQV